MTVPLIAGLIVTDEGEPILIDNGFDDDVIPRIPTPHSLTPGALADGLARHGLAFEDIRLVINTHLHSDHAGMNKAFEKAEIVVQEREYRYALNPPSDLAYAYRPRSPFYDIPLERFNLITGSIQLRAGIWLVHTPGHTPGHQSVAVHTRAGWVLFTGDACDDRPVWEGKEKPGILADEAEFKQSMELMQSLDCHPIFAHDLEFAQHELREGY